MQDTSSFSRPDSFPAASPASLPLGSTKPQARTISHNLVHQNRGWTWAA
jgi:hypothetical protein